MWRSLAARHSVALRIIECCCSDIALHRLRVTTRHRGLAAIFPEPTWEDVERRRLEYTRWTEPVLSVDAASPRDANVERVLAWIAEGPQ